MGELLGDGQTTGAVASTRRTSIDTEIAWQKACASLSFVHCVVVAAIKITRTELDRCCNMQ